MRALESDRAHPDPGVDFSSFRLDTSARNDSNVVLLCGYKCAAASTGVNDVHFVIRNPWEGLWALLSPLLEWLHPTGLQRTISS